MSTKNQRLNATITIGSVLEASVKRNVGFLKTGLSEVGKSIKEVERRQKELDRQRHILRRQGQSVEHLDREYEKLERTLRDLQRAQERYNRAAAASRRVGASFGSMVSDIGRNSRRLAIGATLAGGAIFGVASSTAQLGDDVAKTADKLGIGIEELQELRYAAERSGVATSQFDTALEKMTKNIGLALEGTGAQKDALDALGLSAEDLATMLPEEALAVSADRLQSVETQAEKAAIANDVFGRSGIGMLNMLRDGSRGLQQLREDARRTGYVLSEEAARDAEVFQDTLLDTQLTLKGLKNTVGAELMPVVTKSMKRIGDALIGNRKDVAAWAEAFADGVERALPIIGSVVEGMGSIARNVGSVTSQVAELVGGWENFGKIIGTVLVANTVRKVGAFALSVGRLGTAMWALAGAGPFVAGAIKAIGVAIAANPIGAVLTAIAVGATLIIANWEKVKPVVEPILQWFGDKLVWLWNNAGKPLIDGLKRGADGIARAWSATSEALMPILTSIGDGFTRLYELVKPVIDALKWIVDKGGAAVGTVVDRFRAGGAVAPSSNSALGPRGGSAMVRPQANALGGPFHPGWHLTGELGPELKFENRSGYVANNRALRQLAGYADRVGSLMQRSNTIPRSAGAVMDRASRLMSARNSAPARQQRAAAAMASRVDALIAPASAQAPAATTAAPVTQHITYTINAPGASAAEVIRLIERKSRQAANNGLFDRTPTTGPYGR
ncbi:hypothetical protein [uncultured Tateyamaria sp.]|uniref:hypothetical protein n=1 Tax=uncultured Tateyamaria sp. TaxID=455651 RepID=UPI00262F44F3|nr:hypothetical protein [uncultured Tateyamaria sp.]